MTTRISYNLEHVIVVFRCTNSDCEKRVVPPREERTIAEMVDSGNPYCMHCEYEMTPGEVFINDSEVL